MPYLQYHIFENQPLSFHNRCIIPFYHSNCLRYGSVLNIAGFNNSGMEKIPNFMDFSAISRENVKIG